MPIDPVSPARCRVSASRTEVYCDPASVLSRRRLNSDRGSNYTSAQFARTLENHGIGQSAGRTGICYDNAMAESFFAALKNERVHRTEYPTREHARRDVVRYIEFWYNTRRRHSGLQYRSPQQVHNEYLEQQLAA